MSAKPLSYQFDPSLNTVRTATGFSVGQDSVINSNQRTVIYPVPPQTAPQAGVLASAPAQIVFALDRNMVQNNIHYLQLAVLKFNLKNNSATNILKMVDGYTLIDNIAFVVGGVTIQTLFGPQMRDNILFMLDSDSSAVATCYGAKIDPVTGLSTNTIDLGGGSTNVYVDLFECFATTANFPLFLLPDSLEIRVTLRYGTQCLAMGSAAAITDCSLTNMQLLIAGERLTDSVLAQKIQEYKQASPQIFRFTDQVFQIANLGSITGYQPTPATQVTIQGQLAMINPLLINLANTDGEQAYYNTYQIKNLDFNNNSETINHNLGTLQFSDEDFLATSPAFLSCQRNLYDFYRFPVVFSEKLNQALANGSNWGSYLAQGQNMQIQIKSADTIANAALNIFAVRYSSLIMDFSSGSVKLIAYPGNIDMTNSSK